MNNNSYICNLIHNNPDTWKQLISDKKITYKQEPDTHYVIFNYDIGADFTDNVVQEARGIVIDTDTQNVVCWPFRKFGNYNESYADIIDWDSARVQEKIDGSIIKLWYSSIHSDWIWSTNSCIYASKAMLSNNKSFMEIIKSTPEYHLILNELNKDYTYIFELVSPENQIVLQYPVSRLYHIGTRNNINGEELNISIGIPHPKEYPLHSLSECIKVVEELNTNDYPDNEGFVVVDKDWHRIKIKSPEYILWHHTINNGNINKETAYYLIYSDDFNMQTLKDNVSEYTYNIIQYYIKAFVEAKVNIIKMIIYARELQKQGKSRKEIALVIKDNKYAHYGFKGLNNNIPPKEIIENEGVNTFLKNIKDFEYNENT